MVDFLAATSVQGSMVKASGTACILHYDGVGVTSCAATFMKQVAVLVR